MGIVIFATQQSQVQSLSLKVLYSMVVGAATGYILTNLAMIDGHGHWLLMNTLKSHNMVLSRLLGFAAISWLLIMLCFCSGVVGGIFSPSLTLAVVLGYASVEIISQFYIIAQDDVTAYILVFALSFFISFMKKTCY